MSSIRIVLITLVAALGAVGALASAAPASAKAEPCWERLLDDWVIDGRIDKSYPASCYREAIRHLPDDLENYSSAREDMERALATSARGGGGGGGERGSDPVIAPPEDQREADPLPGGSSGDAAGTNGESLFDRVLPRATGADSVPLPLLVLAGLALLLLAAAAVSFAARRLQARRVPLSGPPGPRA
jgi:hypothetical protein